MFAVTIGEVGLQVAALIRAGHWVHFLPAYSHLFLATMVVTTSWVGWSVSRAPGARHDVGGIFQGEFLVLLVDVMLVVVYFILVRSVEFAGEKSTPHIGAESTVTFWLVMIFVLYSAWDVLTKIVLYLKYREKFEGKWFRNYGSRMIPTLVGLLLVYSTKRMVDSADSVHVITADLALLFVILFFRSLKDLFSLWLKQTTAGFKRLAMLKWPLARTAVCATGLLLGNLWTACSWPLPASIVRAIETTPASEKERPETLPGDATQAPERVEPGSPNKGTASALPRKSN